MGSERSRAERSHFDDLAAREGNHWWGNETAAGQQREEDRFNLVAEAFQFSAETSVLELGCATGDFTRRLARTSAMVTAIDISPGMIGLAIRRHRASSRVTFCVADGGRLGFQDRSFDLVVGNAVLHHLPLEDTLPEIQRVLVPGGKMIFAEPNLLNPQVWIEKKIGWIGSLLQNSADETAFLRWTLKRELERIGFVGVGIRPFDFLHPATPRPFIGSVRAMSLLVEKIPLLSEIAGSLLVVAEVAGTSVQEKKEKLDE